MHIRQVCLAATAFAIGLLPVATLTSAAADSGDGWSGTVSFSRLVSTTGHQFDDSCYSGGPGDVGVTSTATMNWHEQVATSSFNFSEPASGNSTVVSAPESGHLHYTATITQPADSQCVHKKESYTGAFTGSNDGGTFGEQSIAIKSNATSFTVTLTTPNSELFQGTTTFAWDDQTPPSQDSGTYGAGVVVDVPISGSHADLTGSIPIDKVHEQGTYSGIAPDYIGVTTGATVTIHLTKGSAGGAPNTSITGSPASKTTSRTAKFTFTSTQAGGHFFCKLDAGAASTCSSPKKYSKLVAGAHTFTVTAVNSSNVKDPTPAAAHWRVVAPRTTLTVKPPASTSRHAATLRFTSNEKGATFRCRLDGAKAATCHSPVHYTGLSLGSHSFRVYAIGPGGVRDASPAMATWKVVKG